MRRAVLPLMLVAGATPAAADPFDWSEAADGGGLWTSDLGRHEPGALRALVGRTSSGAHDRWVVAVIVDDRRKLDLVDEMADGRPQVALRDGRLVVTLRHLPAGAARPVESRRCFAWDAGADGFRGAPCP